MLWMDIGSFVCQRDVYARAYASRERAHIARVHTHTEFLLSILSVSQALRLSRALSQACSLALSPSIYLSLSIPVSLGSSVHVTVPAKPSVESAFGGSQAVLGCTAGDRLHAVPRTCTCHAHAHAHATNPT
jgi:hypothetical protein